MTRHGLAPCALAAAFTAAGTLATADTILLHDGRRIEASSAWLEGTEIRYLDAEGVLFAVPRERVASVESASGAPTLVDPDVSRSAARLLAGDADDALRLARLALFRQPASVPALHALAAAQLALGDARRAKETAEAALASDPRDAYSHELLADALAELADFVGAREQYRMSLELDPQARVRGKLETVFASAASSSSARLQIRYEGSSDEPLGLAVLRILDVAWAEYEKRLGFAPDQAVTVVLETATSFRDTTRAPEWAAAWNDGTIRVPVAGLSAPTPGLVRVLRHELAHSFVASRAKACPTWLHEGIAQWLEGRESSREDAWLGKRSATTPLPRLESLESPFVGLSEAQATTAYAASLSAVSHLLRRRGEAGLRRLLESLAAGHPAAEALPEALALSYGEFQRDWEAYLGGAATRRGARR